MRLLVLFFHRKNRLMEMAAWAVIPNRIGVFVWNMKFPAAIDALGVILRMPAKRRDDRQSHFRPNKSETAADGDSENDTSRD